MTTKRYGSGDHFKRIYLVVPKHLENFWSMQGTVNLLWAKTLMPNAALAILMALTPPDENVEYVLCDENVSKLGWNMSCDLVAVTGATLHKKDPRVMLGDLSKGVSMSHWEAPTPASTTINATIWQTISFHRRGLHLV